MSLKYYTNLIIKSQNNERDKFHESQFPVEIPQRWIKTKAESPQDLFGRCDEVINTASRLGK